jgi:proteasome beta subunit
VWTFPLDDQTSSFYEYLTTHHPHLLYGKPSGSIPQLSKPESPLGGPSEFSPSIPKGTTVLALRHREGAVIGGDRMATEGYQVSARRIEKVYRTDDYSAIAIAGAAGPCIEMARLFQIELEHYEKLEGAVLSTEGKANKLAQMVKGNLAMAIQGLIVIPIFVGYDLNRQEGRIFKYDITGGRYEEIDYYATGSGGKDARNTMKKSHRSDMTKDEAIALALEALYDASEEDVATAGPDLLRGIYPTAKTVTREGIQDVGQEKIKQIYHDIIERRRVS